jgi:catechol 2,3-dioxygenase-like lactoylglutathione lyase family enzyme
MTNREIGRRLRISLDGVKFHVTNALGKLALARRADLKHWRGVPGDSILGKRGQVMTGETRLGAIGQISRQVRDIPRAVDWYRDTLGLRHLFTFGDLAFFDCNGIRLFLTSRKEEKEGSAGDSVIYFKTDDIHAAHRNLSAKGVAFRGAPHLIHRHESGMEEWMAFFDDLDGQPLALMSQITP